LQIKNQKNQFTNIHGLIAFSAVLLAGAISGCSSNPNKAKDLDTKLDTKGAIGGEQIGLNDNKEVVIQKQANTDAELRELGWKEYDLEQKIHSDHELLTQCREELADPRLGGSGNMTEIPEIDTMKTPAQAKEELGITENGQLKLVKKEFYMERLKAERDYVDSLKGEQKLIGKYKANCEREMKISRVKHGLPSDRYTGKGYYKDGVYVQTRRAEHNLDDAFSIASEEAHKRGTDNNVDVKEAKQ
jgi:hypothetical protein